MSDALLDPLSTTDTAVRPRRRRAGWVAAALLLVLAFGAAAVARIERRDAAVRFSEQSASGKPAVSVVESTAAPATTELALPGNTEAVVVADIYARATGYVKTRRANIGDRVRAGQLLAEIESPELDQDLARARASVEESRAAWQQAQANVTRAEEAVIESRARLEQSQANEALASATTERWSRLVQKGVLPKQEGDERQFAFSARKAETAGAQASIRTAQASAEAARASVFAAAATIRANQANVSRLERLVAFERVVAPFDGIITERKVEQGDLISSGGVDGGRKLFAIAQPSVLRVQINVPQSFAPDIKQGQDASLSVRERPGQTFTGKVARTANALNSSSRTLLVEVQVDNHEGTLLPGMFSEVKFALQRARPVVVIPADALLANTQGTRVAVVDPQGKVRFRNVEVGRDLGAQIEIASGLNVAEQVVINPGETLVEGQDVETGKPAGAKN
ncbi:MAG: efflux transporter periplasmic adaptor subunit [Candidatus Solibacter sp.]|nr:efflux transporter periplasmic adaptor subunit [Candidatus Solibacter sp.]